jgi:hypothetical protein
MRVIRLMCFVFVIIAAFAVSASAQIEYQNYGDGSGSSGGSCMVCHGVWDSSGMSLSCDGASGGGWGQQYCRIESYPEGTYCFTDGNDCCVD